MKVISLIMLILTLSISMGYSQKNDSKSSNKQIEMNKNIDTKNGYNYFLLDMVRDVDIVYTEYEEMVQRVWDNEIDLELENTATSQIKKVDAIRKTVIEMQIFQGGLEYRNSVLDYIEAVKDKIRLLEKYGILGADANSDVLQYNDAARIFYEANNVATEKRNIIRQKKAAYEKAAFIR